VADQHHLGPTVLRERCAGKEVVKQLLADAQWSKVVTVGVPLYLRQLAPNIVVDVQLCVTGRREVAVDGSDTNAAKLVQKVVDMDQLQGNVAAFEGATAVFCALGTTRKVCSHWLVLMPQCHCRAVTPVAAESGNASSIVLSHRPPKRAVHKQLLTFLLHLTMRITSHARLNAATLQPAH
jgi:hypothetical protein